ncbi:hypothetical protein [Streptomyces noursei]
MTRRKGARGAGSAFAGVAGAAVAIWAVIEGDGAALAAGIAALLAARGMRRNAR